MAEGDVEEAIAVGKEDKRVAPGNFKGWYRMGRVYKLQKQGELTPGVRPRLGKGYGLRSLACRAARSRDCAW